MKTQSHHLILSSLSPSPLNGCVDEPWKLNRDISKLITVNEFIMVTTLHTHTHNVSHKQPGFIQKLRVTSSSSQGGA